MLVGLPQKLKKKGEAEEMASLPSIYKFLSPTLWLHWIIYINTFHTEVEHFHLPWYEKMLGNLLQPFFFSAIQLQSFQKIFEKYLKLVWLLQYSYSLCTQNSAIWTTLVIMLCYCHCQWQLQFVVQLIGKFSAYEYAHTAAMLDYWSLPPNYMHVFF